jgi:hypothetical protein
VGGRSDNDVIAQKNDPTTRIARIYGQQKHTGILAYP